MDVSSIADWIIREQTDSWATQNYYPGEDIVAMRNEEHWMGWACCGKT